MKVLFALLDAGVGGGQLVAARVAAALHARGDEIGLVVPTPGPTLERFTALGTEVSFLDAGTLRRPGAVRRLSQLLRNYDLLYSHTSLPGVIVGASGARLGRRPHVVHQHTYPYFSRSQPGLTIQHALFPRIAGTATFLAVAAHVADGLVEAGIEAEQITVVPNGVPTPDPAARAENDEVVIGALGRFDPGKNLDVFVDAAARTNTHAPVKFVVGGVSSPFAEYERGLRASASAAGVEIIPGTDGEAFLRSLDIVVIPSAYEGSPLVLLEAMALGRAVVASDIPGMREVIGRDGGLLVPVGDPDALAAAVRQLADNPELRATLGARAAEIIQTQHGLEGMLKQTLGIIDSVA